MRIQIVSWRDPQNPKAGGAEVCLVEISKRLASDFGHRISWFAPRFEGGAATSDEQGIPIERRGRFSLVHLHVMRKFLRPSHQTADFYLEDYHGLTLGLGWYMRKPHVVLVHEVAGPIWLEMWRFPLSWVGYGLEKASLRLLSRTHFIAVSESTRRDLMEHGVRAEQISTITEGSDLPRVTAPRARAARRQQFVFVGRICKMKRVDLLLETFALHRKVHPDSRLVLAGAVDEDFRPELEELTARLDLASSVELRGRISQEAKAELLQESLALASCSMREGFGLVVVEANAQGTPALTFHVNGYRDLIESGQNGFMVDFPDVAALAREMNEVVAMPEGRYEALCAASLGVSEKYSWERAATQVNEIIAQLTSRDNHR